MSNNVLFYTQIGSILLFILIVFALYRLLVQQKDATIELLRQRNEWFKDQLEAAQNLRPDVLVERLGKRLKATESELVRLNEDHDSNATVIAEKEKEREELLERIEDLKQRIDECPHCEAELITLGGDEDEYRAYSCGYSRGTYNHPCPYDPNFPTLEDYELVTQKRRETWYCSAKPKTKTAEMLDLDTQRGRTEEEARQRVAASHKFHARSVPKRQ